MAAKMTTRIMEMVKDWEDMVWERARARSGSDLELVSCF